MTNGLKHRCAQLINKDLKIMGRTTAPAEGMDIWSHMMREHNWEADALTQWAREEGDIYETYEMDSNAEVIWGSFDGGKDDTEGTATGWTLWAGRRRHWRRSGQYHDADFTWRRIARGASRRLSSESSTSVELAAAEALFAALELALAMMQVDSDIGADSLLVKDAGTDF